MISKSTCPSSPRYSAGKAARLPGTLYVPSACVFATAIGSNGKPAAPARSSAADVGCANTATSTFAMPRPLSVTRPPAMAVPPAAAVAGAFSPVQLRLAANTTAPRATPLRHALLWFILTQPRSFLRAAEATIATTNASIGCLTYSGRCPSSLEANRSRVRHIHRRGSSTLVSGGAACHLRVETLRKDRRSVKEPTIHGTPNIRSVLVDNLR